jgi:hypothetical protein
MHGLYLLWWVQERQLSPAVVAAVLAAGDLALMALELPTGRFADRFGHRASLILGSVVQVAGMLWCWLGRDVPDLVMASLLVALGDAFRSGADEALLYRTCVALDREEAFQEIEARTRSAELIALVALVLAGGLIVHVWGFAAGWLAEVALCASGLAIAYVMVEPPREIIEQDDHLVHARKAPVVSVTMAVLIMPASLLSAAAGAAAFLAQTSGMNDPGRMTVLVAAITLVEAAGAAIAARLPAVGARGQVLLAGAGAVLLGTGLLIPAAFYLAVFGLSFLVGVAQPLRAAAIQRLAADGVRARAASLASACDMAFSTVGLPAAGLWRSRR